MHRATKQCVLCMKTVIQHVYMPHSCTHTDQSLICVCATHMAGHTDQSLICVSVCNSHGWTHRPESDMCVCATHTAGLQDSVSGCLGSETCSATE